MDSQAPRGPVLDPRGLGSRNSKGRTTDVPRDPSYSSPLGTPIFARKFLFALRQPDSLGAGGPGDRTRSGGLRGVGAAGVPKQVPDVSRSDPSTRSDRRTKDLGAGGVGPLRQRPGSDSDGRDLPGASYGRVENGHLGAETSPRLPGGRPS